MPLKAMVYRSFLSMLGATRMKKQTWIKWIKAKVLRSTTKQRITLLFPGWTSYLDSSSVTEAFTYHNKGKHFVCTLTSPNNHGSVEFRKHRQACSIIFHYSRIVGGRERDWLSLKALIAQKKVDLLLEESFLETKSLMLLLKWLIGYKGEWISW